jgi:hypothetical protein
MVSNRFLKLIFLLYVVFQEACKMFANGDERVKKRGQWLPE